MARPRTISDQQILETALGCFLEHGPGVSTDVIANELGVSPQALFKRFHSKQELMLAAVVPPSQAPWIPLVESGPDDRPLAEQLTEILNEIAVFFVDIARRINVLRWSGVDFKEALARFDEPPPLVDIRVLAGWFKRAYKLGLIRRTDFEATALLVLTSLHGPEMLTDMLNQRPTKHSQREYVDYLVQLLTQGLLCPEHVS